MADLVSDPLGSQFSQLIGLLTDHLKGAGQPAAKSDQVTKTELSVKNQGIANLITMNKIANDKLRGTKRKGIEHRLDAQAFKRTKLDDGVGSRRNFTTAHDQASFDLSGLDSCFSDWLRCAKIYKGNLTVAVQDKWILESETDKLDAMITRTWDENYNCVICLKPHPILHKGNKSFGLVIGDHHLPAAIPGVNGAPCIPCVRYHNASISSIGTHIFWLLASCWEKTPRATPVTDDAFGPVTVLNRALLLGKEIHVFISSGSGMRADQATGYSVEMQRIINLTSSRAFGEGRSTLFKNVVFLQPAIPFLKPPTKDMDIKQQMALVEIEAANTARRLCINSSSKNNSIKTFLSATESVGMTMEATTDSPIREMTRFPVLTNLKNHTDILSHSVLKPCQLTFNRKFEWLDESRSNRDGSLCLEFLSEYAAAVQVDYAHALSRAHRSDLHAVDPQTKYQVVRPKVTREGVLAMVRERARLQNMNSTESDWNVAVNKLIPFTCCNFFTHRSPQTFVNETDYDKHRKSCAGPVAGSSGRGRGRSKLSRPAHS